LTTYELISAHGEGQGIPRRMIEKINQAKAGGAQSLEVARAAGLPICSGSDVLAAMQPFKALELSLKAAVLGTHAAIISATRTNAQLFGLLDQIGTVEEGKLADLILVDGQPLDDLSVLQDPERIVIVMRDGEVMKERAGIVYDRDTETRSG
jgi:imidazolonepropionase-like amidohydrolase